ncbi:response regulator [Gracilinema caldarium]|uniref:diguanylate cyclase n=1 Tax=Gracilinema caldarium (strain ATCC 51460 / DSM 7334 / H1) TaxID=744872 RepID=F8EXS8_GRAC1|nr:response regulator [Gracilinema caldarium]AEJ20092.1 response regulator receiver modulated diguanylate cyclase [Gracilinema caldarium DSM 7334]
MLQILHIDRSELFRKIMQEIVLRCGHSVHSVATKHDALSFIAKHNIDLIITALEFNDGDAESFILDLPQATKQDIPVVVVTSSDSLELRERLFSLGVVDYILKTDVNEDYFKHFFATLSAEDELSRFMRDMKIAILDDSPIILKVIHRILDMNGFRFVDFYIKPGDLLHTTSIYDLYLIDIVLPELTGDKVIAELRSRQPNAIIISMSQFTGEKSISTVLLAGADDYIHKPFDAASLLSRIKINVRSFQYKKRLELMAVTDGLTGLYNHRFIFERLEEEHAKVSRYGRPLSVIMLDIDNFKHVNDTFGHRTGDVVIQSVAHAIMANIRKSDVAGRYGGEEFLILLPETGLSAAKVVAEKIRSTVAQLRFETKDLGITISAGVVQAQKDESYETLVNKADTNLYNAKRGGKNQVEG